MIKSSNIRLGIILILSFVIFTITGTILHEAGHYLTARVLGYSATIHYNYTSWGDPGLDGFIFPKSHIVLVTAGGVFSTIAAGTVAFVLLIRKRRKIEFDFPGIFLVMFGFFWSRQVFVFLKNIINNDFYDPSIYSGDEIKIAVLLDLPPFSVSVVFGLAGIAICSYIILGLIEPKRRRVLILSGIIGSITGYFLWFKLLGPMILP